MIRSYRLNEQDVQKAVALWLNSTVLKEGELRIAHTDVRLSNEATRGTSSVVAVATQKEDT